MLKFRFAARLVQAAMLVATGLSVTAHGEDRQLGVSASIGTAQLAQASPAAKSASKAGINPQANLDALIKSARAEGEVLFYSTATENVAKRVSDAFTAKY